MNHWMASALKPRQERRVVVISGRPRRTVRVVGWIRKKRCNNNNSNLITTRRGQVVEGQNTDPRAMSRRKEEEDLRTVGCVPARAKNVKTKRLKGDKGTNINYPLYYYYYCFFFFVIRGMKHRSRKSLKGATVASERLRTLCGEWKKQEVDIIATFMTATSSSSYSSLVCHLVVISTTVDKKYSCSCYSSPDQSIGSSVIILPPILPRGRLMTIQGVRRKRCLNYTWIKRPPQWSFCPTTRMGNRNSRFVLPFSPTHMLIPHVHIADSNIPMDCR